MNTPSEEPSWNAQETREAELEQAKSSLQEELTNGSAGRSPAPEEEEQAGPQTHTRPHRSSRRKMLTKGLGVAAVASMGAGALLELSGETAQASSVKPGVFASNTAGTPAVKATGTNGADGVDASSDSGTGVSATSTSGTGLVATSSTGLAAHFVGGNVSMDKNLTVAGALSTGTLSSGTGAFASSAIGTPSIQATGTHGAFGVDATSDSGFGVFGQSTSSSGVFGQSTSGIAVVGSSISSTGVAGSSGTGAGVVGSSSSGFGVSGTSGTSTAVFAQSTSGTAVFAQSSSGDGVVAFSTSTNGVVATSNSSNPIFAGIHGANFAGGLAGLFEGNVQVNGNFSATGTKAFVQAHPTDPGQEIAYVALEGGEAGTYMRGSGQLQSGKAVIALPEHFGLVTATSGLTVQLTPRGEWLQLYVVELDTAQLVVREAQGKSGAFDYFIQGVRRGYEQYEVIRTKH